MLSGKNDKIKKKTEESGVLILAAKKEIR